jgi:hypothetical protein
MKNLVIVAAGFLIVTGWVAEAWAHGPGGFRSGTRSDGYSKPSFHRPIYRQPRTGFPKHYGSSRALKPYRYGNVPPHIRYPNLSPTSHGLPRIQNGVLYSKPGPLQNRTFYSPLVQSYNRGFGVSPLRKALERKRRQKAPRHFHSPHLYYHENPDPWFLYGKGDQFRRMGILPPKRRPGVECTGPQAEIKNPEHPCN